MNINPKRTGLTALIAVMIVSSMVAGPVMAAGVAFSDTSAPDPAISADVTVDEWDGADFDSALEYYDDSGNAAQLPATVNESNDNPITLTATDIDYADRNEFPRKADEDGENVASALDDTEYTVSGATVGSTTTAPGVDALSYTGSATSDSATYGNFTNADAEKAYLTLAADISSASGTPTIQVTDTDGDYVEVTLYDATANASDDAVLANSTGEGKVVQTQLGDLNVQGSGDGTLGEATEITINGEINMDVSALDAERNRALTFGEKLVENDDDELETVEITEPRGEYAVADMGGFDEAFSDATIRDLTVDAEFAASDLSGDDVDATFNEDNDYPQWDVIGDINYRLELPSAFDLSYANAELTETVTLPGERFLTVEIAEATGDTEFSEIEDSSYTDVTSSYSGGTDSEVSLDSTISPGTEYVVSYDLKLIDDEASAMESIGGGAAPMGGSSGGIVGFLTSLPGMIISGIVGILGIRRLGGA